MRSSAFSGSSSLRKSSQQQLPVELAGQQLPGLVLLGKFLHQPDEGLQLIGGPGDGGEVLGVGEDGKQALPHLLGDLGSGVHGLFPDAPAGGVDDAQQADLVLGVVDDA